ncbi:hypothetical protein, partial [Marinobacter sp.]|uniref:hypothetical protein n=1 Tax=Marinobacter sp. TaxID=50741 RepID=UPI0032640237
MTGEGLLVLEASGGFLEPFRGSAFGFHLRHFLKLRILFLRTSNVALIDKSPASAGDHHPNRITSFFGAPQSWSSAGLPFSAASQPLPA